MIYTTLNRIREHSPCADGWRKLLTHLGEIDLHAPLAYSTILDSNGLHDALWCLRAEPQHSAIWRMFAVRCARRVQHLMTDERSILALDVAERHAHGLATDSELDAARAAARAAAWSPAWDAAWSPAWAAAWSPAWAAAWAAVWSPVWATAWGPTWATAWAEQTVDFRAMLAAHHAMPGESCALAGWWQGGEQ